MSAPTTNPRPALSIRASRVGGRVGLPRVEFGYYSFDPLEAELFAQELQAKARYAQRLPAIHEMHVDLLGWCPLCVAEAGNQPDRLTYDEEVES